MGRGKTENTGSKDRDGVERLERGRTGEKSLKEEKMGE